MQHQMVPKPVMLLQLEYRTIGFQPQFTYHSPRIRMIKFDPIQTRLFVLRKRQRSFRKCGYKLPWDGSSLAIQQKMDVANRAGEGMLRKFGAQLAAC